VQYSKVERPMSAMGLNGHRGSNLQCPLYPRERTFIAAVEMSALGHLRTHALQQLRPPLSAGNCEFSPDQIERFLPIGGVVPAVTVYMAVHWENNLPAPRSPPQRNMAAVCHLNDLH
jgi:hypothetical protein